jgi:predicted ATP-grasp superfamily ATP-dependent carboligase
MIDKKTAILLKTSDKNIALISNVNHNGILWCRALRREKVPVLGLFMSSDSTFYHTNTCKKLICEDIWEEGVIDTLIEVGETAKNKPVLIPISDLQVLLFSQYRDVLSQYFLFNIPRKEVIETLMDKSKLYEWGHNHFNFPQTFVISSEQDIKNVLEKLKFPVIFKPKYRNLGWYKSDLPKANLCCSAKEILSVYHMAKNYEKKFILSEYIPGKDSNIFTCHVYYRHGELLAIYLNQKIRQYPVLLGSGSLCLSTHNEELERVTTEMFDKIEYSGVGSMGFKKDDRNGDYKIIEPCCGRPSSHFCTGLAERINLPFLVYSEIVGKKIPTYEQSARRIGFIDEKLDLMAAIEQIKKKELSIFAYLKSLSKVRICVYCSLVDPMVGVIFMLNLIKKFIQSRLGKMRNLVKT